MGTYGGVAADGDINAYSQTDLKDLAQAGIGTGFKETVVWISLIVLMVIISLVISLIIGVVRKAKGLGGGAI